MMVCFLRSRPSIRAGRGGSGRWNLRDRTPAAIADAQRRHARGHRADSPLNSIFFIVSGRHCERRPAHVASCCLAISRSTSLTIALRSGAHRDSFQLDATGQPLRDFRRAARLLFGGWPGVGNPLHDWSAPGARRVQMVDRALRDAARAVRPAAHRSFPRAGIYWAIPSGATTGRDESGGLRRAKNFLRALQSGLSGRLPVIAEDLGVITPAVERLRDAFHLPGMRILQYRIRWHTRQPVPAAQSQPQLRRVHRHAR